MEKISSNIKKYNSNNPLKKVCLSLFKNNIIKYITSLPDANTILDAGCGEGMIIQIINKNFSQKKISGCDINKNSLAIAKTKNPLVEFQACDIAQLLYRDNAFDLTICLEVLEHLPNPEKALAELLRVAKKYCLISVPFEPWFSLGNLLSGKNIRRLGNDPDHINLWNKKEISDLASKYFNSIKVEISFPWTIILCRK